MAATIAEAEGGDSSRVKYAHRLGSQWSKATAATWNTKAIAYVARDGSGYVEVRGDDGEPFHRFDFGPEDTRRG